MELLNVQKRDNTEYYLPCKFQCSPFSVFCKTDITDGMTHTHTHTHTNKRTTVCLRPRHNNREIKKNMCVSLAMEHYGTRSAVLNEFACLSCFIVIWSNCTNCKKQCTPSHTHTHTHTHAHTCTHTHTHSHTRTHVCIQATNFVQYVHDFLPSVSVRS